MLEKYTLKNGIPVFIVENHAAPVVSVQAWVARGSVYEPERLAGISHFLEHALFKGTKRRAVGQIALEIESRGGEVNAFTSFEETAYYATLASRYFEEGLDVIADALQAPAFDAEEMAREREVILEEIRRAQDSPYKMVSTNLWKTCFAGTPYGRPVLGFDETVKKIDHRTLKEYFSKNYHAGTTSVFIVGDVDAKKAFRSASKLFGRMKRGSKGKAPKPSTKIARQPRIITLARDVNECHVQFAVPAPSITDPSIPAMDLMCTAIGQGESSRLYQKLVKETRLVQDAQMSLVGAGGCGLATIGMVVSPENLVPAIREAMSVLRHAAEHGLQESEIERVKSSLEAEVVSGKETVEGHARRLGYYHIQFGDPDYEKRYLEAVLGVEVAEATEAMHALFSMPPALSMVHPKALDVKPKELSAAFEGKLVRAKKKAPVAEKPEMKTFGSFSVVTRTIRTLPVVAVRFIFPGGMREEPTDRFGVAQMFQRLWTSGTTSYSSLQIAHTLESLGASLHAFAGKNTLGISMEFLSKHWPMIKPLLSEILISPTFPAEEFTTEKSILLREIRSERDTPGQVCHLNFVEALYGPTHPYGRSSSGAFEAVSRLQPAHLNEFYRDRVHQNGLVVSAVGNLDRDIWLEEIGDLCRRLPSSGKPSQKLPSMPGQDRFRTRLEKKEPLYQSHVLAGFLGATLKDPDRYALKLLSSCLAGQGGRLFLELRDRQSLAYTVSPICQDAPDGGMFAFYIGCSPEKLDRALSGIRTEINKVLERPISSKELERAKQFWIGRFELEMQRYGAQAMLFGLDEAYGIGFDHPLKVAETIKSISAEDILTAARKFLLPERATLSIVHNEVLEEERVQTAWLQPTTTGKTAGRPLETSPPPGN